MFKTGARFFFKQIDGVRLEMVEPLDKVDFSAHNKKDFRHAKLRGGENMRAVITVIGKDMVGILAKISAICAENDVNVMEVTQSVLQDLFAMIMLVDISKCKVPFSELSDRLNGVGKDMNLAVHVMHEDIFNSMHRI